MSDKNRHGARHMRKDKIFTKKADGRLMEIGNWEARSSENDVFIGVPLSDSALRKLRKGREVGKSDRQIFYDIHQKKQGMRPAFSIEELTVRQLAKIASDLLEEELDTLNRLSREDLMRLVKSLAKIKKVSLGFDVNL